MDILNNNTKFYEGYEGEKEVIFQIKNNKDISLHTWDGYIDDIVNHEPGTNDDYKYGLSHDWNTFEGPLADEPNNDIDKNIYYKDLLRFKNVKFEYEETKELYSLLLNFIKYAIDNDLDIEMFVE